MTGHKSESAEMFRLDESRLRRALEHDEAEFGCVDLFTDVEDLAAIVQAIQSASLLEAPPGIEIVLYPSGVDERGVVVITDFSLRSPNAHVVVTSEPILKLASSEARDQGTDADRTVEVLQSVAELASQGMPLVRELERFYSADSVARHAAARPA